MKESMVLSLLFPCTDEYTIFDAVVVIRNGEHDVLFSKDDVIYVQPFSHNDQANEMQNFLAEKLLAVTENEKLLVKKLNFKAQATKIVITLGREWTSECVCQFEKEIETILEEMGMEITFTKDTTA